MTVKMIIGSCLMFSCLFLCVKADKVYIDVTEDEFANMKGNDISASCGNQVAMQDTCNHIRKLKSLAEDNAPFAEGYPKCHDTNMQIKKNDGTGVLLKKVTFLICSWSKCYDYYFWKGKSENSVMSFDCNPASCLPYNEFQYA